MEKYRKFLKNYLWENIIDKKTDTLKTDQYKNVPHPPLQKKYPKEAKLIELVTPDKFTVAKMPIIEAIKKRKSCRKYSEKALTLEELSFLLWATQGVHRTIGNGMATQRTVPSGGARHPFETYLIINRVEGVKPGLHRYLALEHKLYRIQTEGKLTKKLVTACMDQKFVGSSAVTFVWTAIPYRTEWRYGKVSHKLIAIDAGHVCQNLYLACEAINAGACAIGAYFQRKMDKLLGVDGKEEFAFYVAPVGKTE
jgi:SagB-type dehydrogenase family enzyme